MEIRQLNYFVQTARLGSFTRAAKKCFVSQPSLSHAISKLELELKTPLFERFGRRIQLTEAGRVLLDRAEQILALALDAKLQITDSQDVGRVVVGSIPTIGPYFLPQLLTAFSDRYPHARVEVREDTTARLVDSCVAGEIDLILAAMPLDEAKLQAEPLFREELHLILATGHKLARRKRISIKELMGERFILLADTHCLSEQIGMFCQERQFQPVSTERACQLTMVQELVSLEHGISFIPAMAKDRDTNPTRVYRSLSGSRPHRTVAVAWLKHRHQSHLAKRFLETLRGLSKTKKRQ